MVNGDGIERTQVIKLSKNYEYEQGDQKFFSWGSKGVLSLWSQEGKKKI